MSNFSSDFPFKIDLVNSTYAYLDCSIPFVSGFQALTYIECILDRLKFPLLEEDIITLPSQLPLQDIDILNWNFIDKKYSLSACIPEYSFIFLPEKYNDSYCYSAYNNLFSIIGQISKESSNITKNISDYNKFDMNAIVDDTYTKFPCELINLNISNNYQLNCLVKGNKSVEIFRTMAVDTNKDLIYLNISHNYTLKDCTPSKTIFFKSISVNYSQEHNLFNIYLYADMNGFLEEEKVILNLRNPAYIYMECTIPITMETPSEQCIYCFIDTQKFPLNNLDIVTLSDQFIEKPGYDYGIFNWENINKEINTRKCSSNYDILFNPINILDTECYPNGLNSFIVDGNLIANNNLHVKNLGLQKFNLNAIIDSQYCNISCEIFPPDSSNIYSRMYCYSKTKNYAEIFPTITKNENSEENIYINISHKYYYKECPTNDKMIFIKSIETECLSNNSKLNFLIYSKISGFLNEEKIKIYLEDPHPYFIECTIPISQEQSFIQCEMDTLKFPLIKYNQIIMPRKFPKIDDCDILNWNNINKVLLSGNCYKNYSMKFSSSISISPECYDKNYNSFIIKGFLDKKESYISNINKTYTCSLYAFFNDSYFDTILCDIYPPDATSYEFRMFLYTNKTDKIELFQTIATDVNTQETIYINISNYHFELLDCSSEEKIIYFKSVNVNYEQKPLINIDIRAAISDFSHKEIFKIFLNEPNYSYMTCTLPSLESNSDDINIQCIFDTVKFPLIENKTIILPINFPHVQGYYIANSDFNNKEIFINYYNPPYSLIFVGDKYINATCYKIGLNVFSIIGKIIINDNDNFNKDIYTFNNFMIIDGIYSNVSCKIYQINLLNDEYQMDCYTNGTLNAKIFKTISLEQNILKNILIDCNHEFILGKCTEPIKKSIDFKGISYTECIKEELSNNIYLNLNISATVLGFTEEKPISFYLEYPSYYLMNCILPVSRNGELISKIKCSLNALLFPMIYINEIILPTEFPK